MRSSLRQVLFRSATGLDLNFAGGAFSLNNTRTASPAAIPGWSFSRTDTNGTATALDLAGNVIQFATGVPRITNRGILVEEARTNLLLRSTEFDNAAWVAGNSATVTPNTATAPDGTLTADTITFSASELSRLQQATVAANASYAFTIFMRVASGTASVRFGDAAVLSTATLTTTWQRFTAIATVTNPNFTIRNESGGGIKSIEVWQADVQAGAFATSPIITTGAAGTRGADLPSEPFDLPAAYTIYSEAEVTVAQTGLFPTVVSTSGANNGLFLNGSNTPGFNLSNGTYIASLASPVTTGTIVRHAARAETNNVRGAINGTLTTLGTSFTPITGSRIVYVGSNTEVSGRLNGYIRRIRVLPFAATDAQLQALTAP